MLESKRDPLPARVEQRIRAQIELAQRQRASKPAAEPMPFVTVSRQYGCQAMDFATELAVALAREEGVAAETWTVCSRQILETISEELPLSKELMESLDVHTRGGMAEFFQSLMSQCPTDIALLKHLVHTLRALALHGRCILVGRGGAFLTRDLPSGLHVRLVAPEGWRLNHLVQRFGWEEARARAVLQEEEKSRHSFFRKYLGQDPSDVLHFDIVLNCARLSRSEQVESVLGVFRRRCGGGRAASRAG